MEKWLSLILVVVRNYGVVSAASDNILNRGGKLEETRWETEMLRDGWNDKEDKEEFRERVEHAVWNSQRTVVGRVGGESGPYMSSVLPLLTQGQQSPKILMSLIAPPFFLKGIIRTGLPLAICWSAVCFELGCRRPPVSSRPWIRHQMW